MDREERERVEREQKTGTTLSDHERRLTTVEAQIQLLHLDLGELTGLIRNIKWWLTGVGSLYITEQIGFMAFLSKIFKF